MLRLVLLFPIVFTLCSAPLRAQYFLFDDALEVTSDTFQLTYNQGFSNGSVWFRVALDLTKPFTLDGSMYFGDDEEGADGIVFVMQNNCVNGGTAGGGVGYLNTAGNSMGIEFDTYQNLAGTGNLNNADPGFDHIGVQKNGNVDHTDSADVLAFPVQMSDVNENVEDGTWHPFRIVWRPGATVLQVFFDDVLRQELTIDLVEDVFLSDEVVYWGFTSATGGSFANNSVTITAPAPFSISSTAICKGDSVEVILPSLDKSENLVENKVVHVSSEEAEGFGGENMIDGDSTSRWSSDFSDPQFVIIDLLGQYELDSIALLWENSAALDYYVLTSVDSVAWDTVSHIVDGRAGEERIIPLNGEGRYVQLHLVQRLFGWGYSLYEIAVYGRGKYNWITSQWVSDIENDTTFLSPPTTTLFQLEIPDKCNGTSVFNFELLVSELEITNDAVQMCSGDSAIIEGESINGFGDVKYYWSDGDSAQSMFGFFASEDTLIQVVASDTLGCLDTSMIRVKAIPQVGDLSFTLEPIDSVCVNSSIEISASNIHNAGNPEFMWYVNGVLKSDEEVFQYQSGLDSDTMSLVVLSKQACQAVDSVQATLVISSKSLNSSVELVEDAFTYCESEVPTLLIGNLTNAGDLPQFEWFVNGELFASSQTYLSDDLLESGDEIRVQMISSVACTSPVFSEAFVLESIDCGCELIRPNVFSPNGDGVHDLLQFPGIECYDRSDITIFNRYGSVVYSSSEYYIPWDGRRSGAPLPEAVYYYVLTTEDWQGRKASYAGDVLLKY